MKQNIFFFALAFFFSWTFAAADFAPVPASYQRCKVDTDCTMVVPECGCCEAQAINKASKERYQKMAKACTDPKPCNCPSTEYLFKCTKRVCQLLKL